jgi:hypothetical protein
MSILKKRGPRKALRPELPISPAAGKLKLLIWSGVK